MGTDPTTVADGLDRAIDELLAVRVAVSPVPVALLDLALDEALLQSPEYQRSRRTFAASIEAMLDGQWDELPQAVLDVEAAANELVGRAVEMAWRLGLRARQSS